MQNELARLHDRDLVGHLLHLVEQMRRDEDGTALLLDERADHVPELRDAGRVETVAGLVEDQQLGVGEEAARDAETLPHAERVLLHLAVRRVP